VKRSMQVKRPIIIIGVLVSFLGLLTAMMPPASRIETGSKEETLITGGLVESRQLNLSL